MSVATVPGTSTTKLNQIIAVRAGVKTDTEQELTKAYHLLQRKELLTGLARTYKPHDDDGFRYPGESTQVQVKVDTILHNIGVDMSRYFDVTAMMDWTNQQAKADVVILGSEQVVTLLSDVPVSYLMFLQKQLVNVETLIRKLPVLDQSEVWTLDTATDTYRTEPVQTVKTTKVRRNHVKAEATDKHAAQVETYTEDVPIGTWSTVKFSGALPAKRINFMLDRVRTLSQAVKFALEAANMADVVEVNPGRKVFEYLFASPAD